jgi:hypothetical protein
MEGMRGKGLSDKGIPGTFSPVSKMEFIAGSTC